MASNGARIEVAIRSVLHAGRPVCALGTPGRLVRWFAVPVVAAVGVLGGAPNVQAETTSAPAVRIATPPTGALITGNALRVVVRARGAGRRLHVELHNRRTVDVTGRFRPVGRSRLAATLRLGRDLTHGENHLYAIIPRRAGAPIVASSHIVVARPRRGMLRLVGVHRGRHSPIVAKVRVARGARLRARLNGQNVRARFEPDGPRSLRARLAAHDGLRFGRNRLLLTAFNHRGRFQRVVRSFRVRRDRPLVGAGRDRRALAGVPLRLNGRSTRSSRPRNRLRMRWQIVRRPKGSKRAHLRGRGKARPVLVPDVAGNYTLRLRARETRRQDVAGKGPRRLTQVRAVTPAGVDTVTVSAQPNVSPIGVPVQTIVSESAPGIQLGSTFYPAWLGAEAWVQALVLDRATLEQVSVNTYTADWAGTGSLATAIAGLTSDQLVIVSGLGRSAPLSTNAQTALQDALAGPNGIGALLPQGTAPLLFGNWSVIGVPGTPPGTATQCILTYCWIGSGAVPGGIDGNLQQDITGNFTFNWPATSNTFDTRAQGSTDTRNVMQIAFGDNAPETYTSAAMSVPAFQLLWLDSGTLGVRGNFTYAATPGPDCGGSGCIQDLVSQLRQIAADPVPGLIMISSFGKPSVTGSSVWAGIAQTLSGMGANPWVVLGLDGSGDYTLVGLAGLQALEGPNAGAELSQVETGVASARLTGVFERNDLGLWEAGINGNPTATNGPEAFEPELTKILAQAPEPFPPFNTAGRKAAELYIVDQLLQLDIDLTIYPVFGVRANYWLDDSIVWSTVASSLGTIASCTQSCPAGYNEDDFTAVKQELLREFNGVGQVMDFFTGGGTGHIAGELELIAGEGAYTFEGTAKQIMSAFNPPSARGANMGEIIEGAIKTASGFAGMIPGGSPVSGVLNVSAGLVQLTDGLSNNPDGTSVLDPTAFDNDVEKLGWNLNNAWQKSIDSVGLIANQLVSDSGKLAGAVARIDDFETNPGQGWGFNTQNEYQLQQSMSRSLGQYMYRVLLPTVYTAYQCVVPPVPEGNQPWLYWKQNTPSRARWPLTAISPNYGAVPSAVGTGFLSMAIKEDSPSYPSESVLETLFGTNFEQDYQLGLLPKYFLAPAVGSSAGFPLNTGSFLNWAFKEGYDLYDCASDGWQSNDSD